MSSPRRSARASIRPSESTSQSDSSMRHLAEQGYVDLVDKRRTYTKKLEDLTHEDLPALVEADRWRAEEEQEKERERVEFIQEARADLEQLLVVELAGISEAGAAMRRASRGT